MPALNGNLVMSKTVVVSGSLVVGSGAIYILYQMYTFSKQLKRLNCQTTILTDKVYRAESDINELRRQLEKAVSSDDADEEFVDASEDDQQQQKPTLNGSLSSSTLPREKSKREKEVSRSKSLDSILQNLDNKIKEKKIDDLNHVLKRLNELKMLHPYHCDIYWRISETSYNLAEDENLPKNNPKERHKQLMTEAQEAADQAVKLNPQSGDAHRWAAIILGSVTQYMPTQDQIKSAYIIKDHIETAIKYKPDDSLLYHMMGRWCYSVYMLSWVERKLASALFATPPTATLEEALGNFLKAEHLNPLSSISNQLYLAKSFIAKGDYRKAADYLKTGAELKTKNTDDRTAKDEIQKLFYQYKAYAS